MIRQANNSWCDFLGQSQTSSDMRTELEMGSFPDIPPLWWVLKRLLILVMYMLWNEIQQCLETNTREKAIFYQYP